MKNFIFLATIALSAPATASLPDLPECVLKVTYPNGETVGRLDHNNWNLQDELIGPISSSGYIVKAKMKKIYDGDSRVTEITIISYDLSKVLVTASGSSLNFKTENDVVIDVVCR